MNLDWSQLKLEGKWYAIVLLAGVVPLRLLGLRRELGMYAALITLGLVLSHSNANFLGESNVFDTSRQIAMLGILAVGSAFVIVTGGIDLSVGAMVGLVGVLVARISVDGPRAPVHQAHTFLLIDLATIALAFLALIKTPGKPLIAPGLFCLSQVTHAVTLLACRGRMAYDDQILFPLVLAGIAAATVLLAVVGVLARQPSFINYLVPIALLQQCYVMYSIALGGGFPIALAVTLAVVAALLLGLLQGKAITGLNLQPFIVTLGGMLTIRGISQTIVEGGNISLGASTFTHLADHGFFMNADDIPRLPYLAVIFLVVIAVSAYLLHFTVFGRYLFAIGGNRDATEYSGIPVKRVETSTYVISAAMAAVAGVCYAAYIGQMNHNVGISYELSAIAACVLGGFSLRGGEGTIIGVIIGTGVLKIIDNGLDMFQVKYKDADGIEQFWRSNENWRNIVIGVVILLAVILDQLVHIFQQRRRTKSSTVAAASPPAEPPVTPSPEPTIPFATSAES